MWSERNRVKCRTARESASEFGVLALLHQRLIEEGIRVAEIRNEWVEARKDF